MPGGFHNIQMSPQVSRVFVGGPSFHTRITTSDSGYEQRAQFWSSARRRYTIGQESWSDSRLSYLFAFFLARMGMTYGFRFKDWSDFQTGMTYNSGGVGTPNYLNGSQFGTGDGAATVFTLSKTYSDGTYATVRKITRPVQGVTFIYVNGVLQSSGVTVDYTGGTGSVTFSSPPAAGASLVWCGEFDVPARFNTDEFSMNIETLSLGKWSGISIIEIRE